MKIRLLSGSCYVAILVAFFCLKIFLPAPYGDFAFDALIYAFALIGTYEMLRAVKDKTTKVERIFVLLYAAITIPVCAVCEYMYGNGFVASAICLFALALLLLFLLVAAHETTTLESVGLSLFAAIYPVFLLTFLVLCNHEMGIARFAEYGFDSRLMILLIFIISPCADSIAYVFGICFKKYLPKKMAPKLSPNKTVIGGIGGLVGGMLGALILYFIYGATAGSYTNMGLVLPVFLVIGLLASVATAFGDLVESSIKRKVGLKDMGKIMPGHGGALDRIDGTLFATLVVYAVFQVIFLIG
jgi:phosphatidate cytidylyltransferase